MAASAVPVQMVPYPAWVYQLMLHRLGEVVQQAYTPTGSGAMHLQMGKYNWVGGVGKTYDEAVRNAAYEAYKELVFMTEGAIRRKLGLGPRKRLVEADVIRATLESLGNRVKGSVANDSEKAVALDRLQLIGFLVTASERDLLRFGLPGYFACETVFNP